MTTPARICFEVFTLFPAAVEGFVAAGLLGKAIEQGLVGVRCTDFRDFTRDRHRTVDDAPFGGGAGMVIKPGPVVDAMEHVARERGPFHRVLLTPSAPRFDQVAAARLARLPRIGLLCGRYEGIDDRVREHFVDECLSLGDFVLGGGEVAALAIIEAVSRLAEGVLGNPESAARDSFATSSHGALLEFPQYTRPAVFRGHAVPAVLQGGDHAAIAAWRLAASLQRTWSLRPDLRAAATWPRELPLSVAVDHGAIDHAAAWAELARRTGLEALIVLGADAEQVVAWTRASGGRVPIVGFRDLRALRRRHRSRGPGAIPWIVALGDPGERRPAALHDRLTTCAGTRSAAVLLAPGVDAAAMEEADAVFDPAPGPQAGRASGHDQSLAPGEMIVDPSRPAALAQVELALDRLHGRA